MFLTECAHAWGWACVGACVIHLSIYFEFNDNCGAFVGVHMQIWEVGEGGGGGGGGGGGDVAPAPAASTADDAQ